ncbi:hypothetical protein AX16_005720 [Volvariella volvacea WC 439]|nr:hypothetical protein AX16_005720 [Volvariella volvacea WC 439]
MSYQPLTKERGYGRSKGWIQNKVQDTFFENFLRPSVYWPSLIITGQLFLVLCGWTFYGKNAARPTPLPDTLAEQARRFPPATTFVVTCISTLISIASGFLHSQAVRYALTCRLVDPMPLHHLAIGVKIARERTVLSWQFLRWTIVTGFSLTLLGAQTTAWSTLLTPAMIHLPVALSGYELDISKPEVYKMIANQTRNGRMYVDSMAVVAQTIQASGAAAVNAEFGFPGDIVNFNRVAFINSTGGIMPIFLRDVQSTLNTQSHYSSTINIDGGVESPRGFDTSFEMIQQGMTVQATCKKRDPSNVEIMNRTVSRGEFNVDAVNMNVTCADGSVGEGDRRASVLVRMPVGGSEGGTVLAYPCPLTDHPGGYEFVIQAVGELYNIIGTLSCEMIPKLTLARVRYVESGGMEGPYTVTVSILEVLEERDIEDVDFATAPFTFLIRAFQAGQSWWGSTYGNTVSDIYVSGKPELPVVYRTTEAYLMGIFEFGATLMQAILTRSNSTLLPDEIPASMRHNTTGALFIETIGWDFRPDARAEEGASITAPGLVAGTLVIPTLVAISAIAFTVIAIVRTRGRRFLAFQAHVDFGDFMQVMALTHSDRDFPSLDKSEGEFLRHSKEMNLQVHLQKDIRHDQIEMVLT